VQEGSHVDTVHTPPVQMVPALQSPVPQTPPHPSLPQFLPRQFGVQLPT
jgi:hypothetical protein